MIRFSVMFFLAAFATSNVSLAQQKPAPVGQLPEGRHMPGFLIDETSHQYPAEASGRGLSKSFGERGPRSAVGTPNALAYVAPPHSVQYGRAFLKIDRAGPVTFVVTGDIDDSSVPFASCEIILRLSDGDFVQGKIYSPGPGGKSRGGPVVGNVALDPGYYRFEYVLGCPYVRRARYTIAIRGENDAGPRNFLPAELFHVVP